MPPTGSSSVRPTRSLERCGFQTGARIPSPLVMSLWPVDDLATCILITRFYENLYNVWISDINIRARMVRGRAPDTDARPIPAT